MRYDRVSETVDAFRFCIDEEPEWFKEAVQKEDIIVYYDKQTICGGVIIGVDWNHNFKPGDWIIKEKDICYRYEDGTKTYRHRYIHCPDYMFPEYFKPCTIPSDNEILKELERIQQDGDDWWRENHWGRLACWSAGLQEEFERAGESETKSVIERAWGILLERKRQNDTLEAELSES